MASNKKSGKSNKRKITTASNNKDAKSKSTYNKKRDTVKENAIVKDEIILVISFVISVLLFLSYFNLIGWVGRFISDFIFGLIGLEAFILPLILFFGTALRISNIGNKSVGRKLLSTAVFFIALAGLIQMLTSYESMNVFSYYNSSANNRNGGGIIGGVLVVFLCTLFDEIGAYIILIAIMTITVIIITGKAIFTYIAKKSKSSIEEHIENQKVKREQFEVLEGGAEDAEDDDIVSERKPPKTFIIDGENSEEGTKLKLSKGKTKRAKGKKSSIKGEEELPIINLDHLFSEDNLNEPESDIPNTSSDLRQVNNATTYEDELLNKFGNSNANNMNENIESATEVATNTVVEHTLNQNKDRDTKSSTDVEPMDINQDNAHKEYIHPPLRLLKGVKARGTSKRMDADLKDTAIKLKNTLESFGVHVTITNISRGPAVTRYELQPEQGVKVKSITSLSDDIKLSLAAAEVRIEAPIPGKAAVGIEVPNKDNSMVSLREMLESREFKEHPSDIAFAVGKDIGGQIIISDIGKMPHLLIAGATGSGKSVCINTLVMSMIYKSSPSDVRLIMIDPKVVELNVYNGIPHLLIPVVTDPKKASAALSWAVSEMTDRYKKFADLGVRDLKGYNEKMSEVAYLNDETCQKLPQIVIIIDELSDLMMVAPREVEDAICRLAQMARAAGLHLIIATQRPSVNVITGVIKANIPSRIAFAVSSQVDSRTIIDGAGAEKLLGKGDMLFFPSGYPKPVRIQGAFVSDKEVGAVVDFLKSNNKEAKYSEDVNDKIINANTSNGKKNNDEKDEYFIEAGKFIIEKDKASIGMLQRVYRIGFNRAARIMDQLSEAGVVGPEEGTKPRKILMTLEQYEQYIEEIG